jgi:hypothetical protein
VMLPAALLCIGQEARKFRLGDDHKIDALGNVQGGTV